MTLRATAVLAQDRRNRQVPPALTYEAFFASL